MEYQGKYEICDLQKVRTYPIATRPSKTHISDLIDLKEILHRPLRYSSPQLDVVASAIVEARRQGKPVIVFSGAHAVKNGLSPIYNDLISRGVITAFASQAAFTIHDFELALVGKTSENVPNALSRGLFGFAEETGKYINQALIYGNKLKLGYGESLGRLLSGEAFPEKVRFLYPELSVVYNAFKYNIPFCVHCAIGTDIYHMSPYFDGEAIGGCSGRDFLIFVKQITKLTDGGVCLLISSAVVGVEVYLKAFSVAANIGSPPKNIVTADFDMRDANIEDAVENREDKPSYYFRDIKSMVVRIPRAFEGKGYYIKGNHKDTLPALYKLIVEKLGKSG